MAGKLRGGGARPASRAVIGRRGCEFELGQLAVRASRGPCGCGACVRLRISPHPPKCGGVAVTTGSGCAPVPLGSVLLSRRGPAWSRGLRLWRSGGPRSPGARDPLLRTSPQPAAALPAAVVLLTHSRPLQQRGLPGQGSYTIQTAEGTLVSYIHLIYLRSEYLGSGGVSVGARAAGMLEK